MSDTRSPIVIAVSLRPDGTTGVHTHMRQFGLFLDRCGTPAVVRTPFSWGGSLRYPVFGLRRLVLDHLSEAAGVVWYRYSHEFFLRMALRRTVARLGDCVIYAQDPLAARAALRARSGPHQRVVLAVHFRISQADEWADGGAITSGGRTFRAIRRAERRDIPGVDGLVYVSTWGKEALTSWLPEVTAVPSTVVANFVDRWPSTVGQEVIGDLVTTGRLEPAKNHRFLLQVLAEANRTGHSFTLDVFGDGPSRQDLIQLCRSLGLEERVRFRGFCADVRALLPGYRAYVHASYSESLPLSIIEAMAAGLPVVAGDTGGISELCDDGVEARFWPLDDPTRAAQTLVGLLTSEPMRRKAADAARDRFRRDFDTDVVAPRLLSFLLNGHVPT